MLGVLLSDFDIFLFANIESIHVNSWTFFKKILITSKVQIVVFIELIVFLLGSPYIIS